MSEEHSITVKYYYEADSKIGVLVEKGGSDFTVSIDFQTAQYLCTRYGCQFRDGTCKHIEWFLDYLSKKGDNYKVLVNMFKQEVKDGTQRENSKRL
ncbi:MAG: hypothetical protein HY376_02075 [Candidatus Blackburnbacteria bacterium]|nr:hypothetical protein [Candidatus Blackburnbacteria bacterium]